ncbi:MAG: glycine dehydrogenase subunit 2 [Chloroflexi bacterium]|nr:glycine dehydrogenase subunit 2 [Chloroflexota bacterium]
MTEPLLFELSTPGRRGYTLPALDVPASALPDDFAREDLPLPEVSEVEIVRHFTRLSQLNVGVDTVFYPLGSCTMKYNPKINDAAASLPGFTRLHPYQSERSVQGALRLMFELQEALGEIAGLPAVSLQPAAGAHGEFAGVWAYHQHRGDAARDKIVIPDSAHGTNPASAAMCGYDVVTVPSDAQGNTDLAALEALADDSVAGMMLTNPNTIGLFDENVVRAIEIVHNCGGLVYCDGANMNALLGTSKPGDLGFDILHYNLHKTFSTPHGGGGPGAGALAVTPALEMFLPTPLVVRRDDGSYGLDYDRPQSIGRVRAFYGNFGIMVRAYVYIRMMGADGLLQVSEDAVLNANYVLARLRDVYHLSLDRTCMHECVFTDERQVEYGVHTLDIAKRLIDFGYHPPTIYFPHIEHLIEGAIMIEPTETETKATLDGFVEVMRQIAREAAEDPDLLHNAPQNAPATRLDEVTAARKLRLRWTPQ